MAFADLKNDFVFRRIFATHPDILRSLLNDLLERSGDRTIEAIEYLPGEQLPLVVGAKLSILDVRCKDRAGTTFVVEMQLIHVPGFINRVVYNACKAYVSQLRATEKFTRLTDVVAISICDFELWPDSRQKEQGLPLVPADLSPGPYRQALELANKATFTQDELDAYQKVIDEIQQVRDLAEAKLAEGHKAGLAEGEAIGLAKGKIAALLAVLAARGISVTAEAHARIHACKDEAALDRWIARAATAPSLGDVFT